jgi:hypothetical protein
MTVPKIYLETTIFNFPFADDAPQYRADTLRLFEEIRAGKFEPHASEYVIRELDATANEDKRTRMKKLIEDPEAALLVDLARNVWNDHSPTVKIEFAVSERLKNGDTDFLENARTGCLLLTVSGPLEPTSETTPGGNLTIIGFCKD